MNDDICRNRHGGDEHSERANASVSKYKPSQRDRLINEISVNGPAMAEELSERLGMRMSSVAARMSELKRMGWIEATGEERRTTSGEFAAVWRRRAE